MRGVLAVVVGAAIVTGSLAATLPENASVWDGVYTQEQAARGALLYAQHCALCHGPNLQGADGAALTGVDFAGNWNGLSLDALADRIRTTMPPESPGKLSAQQRADIIAHMLSVGRFPSGMTELPSDSQGLAVIQFQATRP
jgi:S-disulfanyl-L-cysteine oxidoreductase SoxD